jgi:hypothetical protein
MDDAIVDEILNDCNYISSMPPKNKLVAYLTAVSKMKPINKEKVLDLSTSEFKIKDPDAKATAPSILTNVVIDNILKVSKTDIRVVLSLLSVLGTKFYEKIKSRDVFYTKIRKPILEKYGKESNEYKQTLDLMKITKEQRTELNKNYNKMVKDRNKDPDIFYSKDILNIIEKTRDDPDWAKQAVGLMIAYGGRPVEVISMNTFKIDKNKKNYIIIENIAKKRADKKDTVGHRPLIGYKPKDFIVAVNDLRDKLKDKKIFIETGSDKGQMQKSVSNNIKKSMAVLFQGLVSPSKIKASLCRKLYGNMSHLLYGGHINLNVWLGDVLSHDSEDKATSFSYSTVKVLEGTQESQKDKKTEISELKEEKVKMEERLDTLTYDLEECKNELKEKPVKTMRNIDYDKKITIVNDTIDKMVEDGVKLSQDSVILRSGVGWRIVRVVLAEYRNKTT